MKKIMRTGSLLSLQEKAASNEMFIASRVGDKIWIQNLEFDSGIKVNSKDGVLTIQVNLKDGEFLSLGDLQGIAEKRFV